MVGTDQHLDEYPLVEEGTIELGDGVKIKPPTPDEQRTFGRSFVESSKKPFASTETLPSASVLGEKTALALGIGLVVTLGAIGGRILTAPDLDPDAQFYADISASEGKFRKGVAMILDGKTNNDEVAQRLIDDAIERRTETIHAVGCADLSSWKHPLFSFRNDGEPYMHTKMNCVTPHYGWSGGLQVVNAEEGRLEPLFFSEPTTGIAMDN